MEKMDPQPAGGDTPSVSSAEMTSDTNQKASAVATLRKDGRSYVQKGTLTEESLLQAREAVRKDLKHKDKTTNEDKKRDRRAANRLSAFQSRQRRKMIIEDLQKTVAEQSKHNAGQGKEIAELTRQLQQARQENEMLRLQVGAAFGATAAAAFGGQFMPNPAQLVMGQPQQLLLQQQFIQSTMNAVLRSQHGGQMDNDLLKGLGLGLASMQSSGDKQPHDFASGDKTDGEASGT